jgi:hypothetical protein
VSDVLAPGLEVVFCGINPGFHSDAEAAHFANRRNDFWRLLHAAGFTPQLVDPTDQHDPFEDAEREQKLPAREAIYQAALLRFRPILMTTLAALFAALPLMFGGGEGSELRMPLGLSIFGGLIVSQVLTLFTTPVIYLGFDRLGRRVRRAGVIPDGAAG